MYYIGVHLSGTIPRERRGSRCSIILATRAAAVRRREPSTFVLFGLFNKECPWRMKIYDWYLLTSRDQWEMTNLRTTGYGLQIRRVHKIRLRCNQSAELIFAR